MPPNLVLISIDSLRADHLSVYGYKKPTSPTIDKLASEGLLFENAFSTTAWTLPSHVAMFTGLDNLAHSVIDQSRRIPTRLATLPELLKARGYLTVGFFSGPYLHPAFGFGRGFDEYYNCTSSVRTAAGSAPKPLTVLASVRDVTNPIVLEEVTNRLARGLHKPFFMFLHLWDVHYDYIPPERYWRIFDPTYSGSFSGKDFQYNEDFAPGMPEEDFDHIVALYDGEIRYTDDTLRQVLEEMEQAGLLRNTVIVLTADHGDEFLEHGGRAHHKTLFDEVVRVPLILWAPGRIASGRRSTLASITDIAPTILELVGVTWEEDLHGRSLLSSQSDERVLLLELHVPQFGIDKIALRSADAKVILDRPQELWAAYNLRGDPQEQRPIRLGESLSPAMARLENDLPLVAEKSRALGERFRAASASPSASIDEETMRHLRALGYVP